MRAELLCSYTMKYDVAAIQEKYDSGLTLRELHTVFGLAAVKWAYCHGLKVRTRAQSKKIKRARINPPIQKTCPICFSHHFKSGQYCGRKCANKYCNRTEESKIKTKETRRKNNAIRHEAAVAKINASCLINCTWCGKEIAVKSPGKRFCSRKCAVGSNIEVWRENGRKAGLKSALSQKRRSKNEIAFADLCSAHFGKNQIATNERMFNGWDADVIIFPARIAVLWNGPWHYRKITKKHSLLQVQTRDAIKISQIRLSGYTPLAVKDLSGSRQNTVALTVFNSLLLPFEIACAAISAANKILQSGFINSPY